MVLGDNSWIGGKLLSDLYERPTGESGWMGTDPRFSDSDYFYWDEIQPSQLEILGDGIPDGWESHHGLDPLNASDAILDSDLDGWDQNRTNHYPRRHYWHVTMGGVVQYFEEYLVDFDDSSHVTPGLRGTKLYSQSEQLIFDHSTAVSLGIRGSLNSARPS